MSQSSIPFTEAPSGSFPRRSHSSSPESPSTIPWKSSQKLHTLSSPKGRLYTHSCSPGRQETGVSFLTFAIPFPLGECDETIRVKADRIRLQGGGGVHLKDIHDAFLGHSQVHCPSVPPQHLHCLDSSRTQSGRDV